jgi:hypothetical protein
MSWTYYTEDSHYPKDSSSFYYKESVDLYNSKDRDLKESILSKSVDLKFLNNEFFYIDEIIRAHSSGYEQSRRKNFLSFDDLLEYLKQHVPIITVEEWSDSDSFFVDQTMKIEAPKPNEDFINILLNPKRLYDLMTKSSNSSGGKIYGPYSKFCCLVPFEIHIYCETL